MVSCHVPAHARKDHAVFVAVLVPPFVMRLLVKLFGFDVGGVVKSDVGAKSPNVELRQNGKHSCG